ncbi:MAG: hypothetical protein ABIF11_01765 [Nitrospirota bacterium]
MKVKSSLLYIQHLRSDPKSPWCLRHIPPPNPRQRGIDVVEILGCGQVSEDKDVYIL